MRTSFAASGRKGLTSPDPCVNILFAPAGPPEMQRIAGRGGDAAQDAPEQLKSEKQKQRMHGYRAAHVARWWALPTREGRRTPLMTCASRMNIQAHQSQHISGAADAQAWRDPESILYGEFDPGSGQTLAACVTHASRTGAGPSGPGPVADGC